MLSYKISRKSRRNILSYNLTGKVKELYWVIELTGKVKELYWVSKPKREGAREMVRTRKRSEKRSSRRKRETSEAPYRGVFWRGPHRMWEAMLKCKGTLIPLGYFQTARDAAVAHDKAAKATFGKYAWLNFK